MTETYVELCRNKRKAEECRRTVYVAKTRKPLYNQVAGKKEPKNGDGDAGGLRLFPKHKISRTVMTGGKGEGYGYKKLVCRAIRRKRLSRRKSYRLCISEKSIAFRVRGRAANIALAGFGAGRGNTCILKKDGFILLDFGFEMQGGIQIVTNIWEHNGNNTARVRVRFGESAMECMADAAPDLRGKKNATNDHAVRDDIHLLSWLGMTEIGNTGFRFVRIDLLDDIELPIKCVRAKFQYRDLDYLGTFECDDKRLNDIWKTAAYTVQLNMQEYVWDGV